MFAKTVEVSKRIDEQVRERQVRAKGCSTFGRLLCGIFLKHAKARSPSNFWSKQTQFQGQFVVFFLS